MLKEKVFVRFLFDFFSTFVIHNVNFVFVSWLNWLGKIGKMKTYWLIQHKNRPPVPSRLAIEDEFIECDHPLSNISTSAERIQEEREARGYSPITFGNVRARYSISEASYSNHSFKIKGKLLHLTRRSNIDIFQYWRFNFCKDTFHKIDAKSIQNFSVYRPVRFLIFQKVDRAR